MPINSNHSRLFMSFLHLYCNCTSTWGRQTEVHIMPWRVIINSENKYYIWSRVTRPASVVSTVLRMIVAYILISSNCSVTGDLLTWIPIIKQPLSCALMTNINRNTKTKNSLHFLTVTIVCDGAKDLLNQFFWRLEENQLFHGRWKIQIMQEAVF